MTTRKMWEVFVDVALLLGANTSRGANVPFSDAVMADHVYVKYDLAEDRAYYRRRRGPSGTNMSDPKWLDNDLRAWLRLLLEE